MKKPPKKPWPTQAAMAQVYEKKLWGEGATAFYSGAGSHDAQTVAAYIEKITAFLEAFDRPLTVCDLGCGDFNVGSALVSYCASYHAVDIVPKLIAHNKQTFKSEHLHFYCRDIAKDPLPIGDCVMLRQVLQHLSNAEILAIVKKLYKYPYLILTEHLPETAFTPNADLISGQGIRLKKNSGVDLLEAPFHFKVKKATKLLNLPAPGTKGRLVTTLYVIH